MAGIINSKEVLFTYRPIYEKIYNINLSIKKDICILNEIRCKINENQDC